MRPDTLSTVGSTTDQDAQVRGDGDGRTSPGATRRDCDTAGSPADGRGTTGPASAARGVVGEDRETTRRLGDAPCAPRARTDGRDLGEDRRGVSAVLGAILMFGVVLALLVLLQVSLVPALNQSVEFQHNQRVQTDLLAFDDAASSTLATGLERSVSVETGVRYHERPFLLNPPPPAGRLTTQPAGEITLSGATATNPETAEYLVSMPGLPTAHLNYRPAYNEYRNAPRTIWEGGVLYNQFGGATVTLDGGSLVSGSRINLVALDGDLDVASRGSASITTEATSAPTRTVSVTNQSGANVVLRVPTTLDEAAWRDALADEMVARGGHVESLSVGGGVLTVTLERGVTYSLRAGEVGVGDGASEEGAYYVTTVSGSGSTILQDGAQPLTLEVRDRFNNPVAGESVTLSTTAGTLRTPETEASTVTAETDEDGRATVTFRPDGAFTGSATVTAGGTDRSDAGTAVESYESATFEIEVRDAESRFGFGSGEAVIVFEGADSAPNADWIEYTLNNTWTEPVDLVGIRLEHASYLEKTGTGGSSTGTIVDGPDAVTEIRMAGETRVVTARESSAPGTFEVDPISMPRGTNTLRMTFDHSLGDFSSGEAAIVSVKLYFEERQTATYDLYLFDDDV